MCPPRTPALLRDAGTPLKSAKTGAIEGSESLSAGSGTTDDRLFVQFNAWDSRDQRTHQTTRTGVFFTGVDMSRKVRNGRTKPSTAQVVVVHIHLD